MRYCGVTFDSNKANLIVLEGTKENYRIIESKITKIVLENETSQESIKKFYTDIKSFLTDQNIKAVAIKMRKHTGKFSGGAVSFKMEAIIQMLCIDVKLIAPTAINKKVKNLHVPDSIYKYQIEAFKTAFCLLN